jgi:hypothetical protein
MLNKILVTVLVLTVVAVAQQSQPATPVQQTATHVDTCTPISVNAGSGSQATLTIPAPPSSQYIYVGEIDFQLTVGTVLGAAIAPTNVTTTGLSTSLQWGFTAPTTANTNYNYGPFTYPSGMKSLTPGSKVTIVGPAGTTNLVQQINACYWYAY